MEPKLLEIDGVEQAQVFGYADDNILVARLRKADEKTVNEITRVIDH